MIGLGRTLILVGLALVLAGGGLLLLHRFGLTRLPGDVVVQRDRVTFFFPLATSLLISLILTLVINLWLRWRP